MPDQFERHGRASGWDNWGPNPSRSQQRAAAANDDPLKKGTPSKRKKGVCKGADGWHDNHELIYVIQPERLTTRWSGNRRLRTECAWVALWNYREQKYLPEWGCLHSHVCSRCDYRSAEHWDVGTWCPDYRRDKPPVPAEVLARCEKLQAEREERLARHPVRHKVTTAITGKTGYRKPKGEKK